MSVQSFYFDGDNEYNADMWAEQYRSFFTNGVITYGNPNAMKASVSGSDLSVAEGRAMIEGYVCKITGSETVEIPAGTTKGRVILRLDLGYEARNILPVFVQGAGGAYPDPVRSSNIYDLVLANVDVSGGIITLTDTRADPALCGYASFTSQPAFYPPTELPEILWLYTMYPDTLTEEQKQAVESNPSLMEMYRNSLGIIRYTVGDLKYKTNEALQSLGTPTSRLAAATNGSGQVLIGGGEGTTTQTSVVYIYNKNGTYSTQTALSSVRGNIAAATLGDGSVLFGGGKGGPTVVDRFIGTSRTTLTALSSSVQWPAAATDGLGRVLFGGGDTGVTTAPAATVDRYDTDGSKTVLTSLSVARNQLVAAPDGNGKVWFGGGYTGSAYSAVIDRYDTTGARTTLSLSSARPSIAAADGDGNILFGGGQMDRFTPEGTRSTLPGSTGTRVNAAAGTDGYGNALFRTGSSIAVYTPDGGYYTFSALSTAGSYFAAATDGEGNVVFAGGYPLSDMVERYSVVNTADISVMLGMSYKFREHEAEQVATGTSITVKRPNEGYIRMHGSAVIE